MPKDTKHYVIRQSERCVPAHDGRPPNHRHSRIVYLCIEACSTTPSKRTRDPTQVTCQNCIRELGKRGLLKIRDLR